MCPKKLVAPLVLLTLLVPSFLGAQEKPAKTFSDATTVVLIEVPVNVVDDGQSVRGLKAENFRVFDGKKEQKLIGFEVVDLEVAPTAAPAKVPTPARRRFLLFFDLAFTPRADLGRSLTGARQLIAGLHPSDVVGLAAYTRARGAELLLNFTTDRKQAGAVLDGIGAVLDGKTPRTSELAGRDPLRLVVDQGLDLALDVTTNDLAGDELGDLLASGSRGALGAAETVAAMSESNVARNRDRAVSYFKGFTNSLKQFAEATTGLDGRRFFVFFSRGFDSSIFSSDTSTEGAISAGGASALKALSSAVEDFRRAGWEIQSVDPGRADSQGNNLSGFDSLLTFAKDTGGTLYRNFNDLGSAMGQMLDRTSVTYLLAFQVEGVRQDGAYHPIKVELKGVPGGAKLYHRSGFFSPRKDQVGIAKAVSTAERILSAEESGDLELHTLLVPFRVQGDKVRIATILETSGEQLLEGHQGGELGVEAYAYAINGNGDVEDFLAQQISLDTEKIADQLKAKRFGIFSDLLLAPGQYQVRVLLRQRQTGRQVLDTVPLTVPNLEEAEAHLSALMLVEQGNEPVLIREKTGNQVVSYPFVVGEGQEFFPAIEPTINNVDPRRLTLFGYGLRSSGTSLGLELVSEQGEVFDNRIQVVAAAPTETDGLDRIYLTLNPKDLPAGKFKIRAQVASTEGEVFSTASTVFSVGLH